MAHVSDEASTCFTPNCRWRLQHPPEPSRTRSHRHAFQTVIWINGRGYIQRSALDAYTAELRAFALGVPPVYQPPIKPDLLVPLKQVCVELGVGRRTVGRRIAELKRTNANAT